MLLTTNHINYNKSWVLASDWGMGGVGDHFEIHRADPSSFYMELVSE